ncbi:MAG: NUDIX hydrolase [Pyrinomonadaceae bacterium]
MKTPKVLNKRTAYDGKIVGVDIVTIDDEGVVYEREIIEHPGSAVVIPLFENRDVMLIRQYRHAAGEYLYEVPAGTLESGESPESCAVRELSEETGLGCRSIEKLTEFYVSPGFLGEKMHLFLATDLFEKPGNLDEDEILEPMRINLSAALEMMEGGKIPDAKTIIALNMLARRFQM